MAPKYNAQSLNQVLQAVADLTAQKTHAREQYAPQTPTPAAPQTPFQGLLSGIIGEHNRRREDAKLTEDNAIQQALSILDLIPDTPENTPKKLQMLTSILHPKTQKGWKEVFNPEADHTAQAQFLQKFAERLPSDAGLSANEQQVRNQQITDGPGALLTQGVKQKYAEQNKGAFEFPDDGQYQGGQIIQTADGLVLVTFDRKTGEPKLKPLGQGKTNQMVTAEIRAQGKGASDNNPLLKKTIAYAKIAANKAEGIPFDQFDQLAKTDPEKYAEYMQLASAQAKEAFDADVESKKLNVPLKNSQVEVNQANAGRGGITGGQAATIQRQDTQDKLKVAQDLAQAQSELVKAKAEMDGIWNTWKSSNLGKRQPDDQLEMKMAQRDPQTAERYRQLRAQVEAAKVKIEYAKQAKGAVVGRDGNRITGNLDWDRVMRRGQQDTSGGQQHYQVVDPAANVAIPRDFNIESFSTPTTPNGFINVGRSVGNPNLLVLNPQAQHIPLSSLQVGGRLFIGNMAFQILQVSSDRTKVLVLKIPGQE